MSQYQDGQRIPRVRFKTEVLPRGTPTERFQPYRAATGLHFLIDVAVEVHAQRIILYALHAGRPVDHSGTGYPLSNRLFPQGLAAAMVHEGHEFPGVLRPLAAPAHTP